MFKTPILKKIVLFAEKYPLRIYVAVCGVPIFSNEMLYQIYFLRIYEIFNINNSSNLDY